MWLASRASAGVLLAAVALAAGSSGTPAAAAVAALGGAGAGVSGAAQAGAGAAGEAAGAGADRAAAAQSARWVKKKFTFVYQGFTTHYSCQGLRDKVRAVLLQLGARRSDLNVHEIGCTTSIGRPEPAPSVGGTLYVLEPASSSTQHAVEAAWQRVKVRVGTSGLDEAGQCELVEQVKQRILPLFSTRDVIFDPHCIPHQLTPSGSVLSVEVLKPAPRA